MAKATREQIRLLWHPERRSGYAHVHPRVENRCDKRRTRLGVVGYRAAVERTYLGTHPTPEQAARAVVEWLIDRYGDQWYWHCIGMHPATRHRLTHTPQL